MSNAHFRLQPADDFTRAKEQFLELNGSTAVMNTYLKIAVLCLCGANIALTALGLKMHQAAQNVKTVVVRVHDNGRTEGALYQSLDYKPQEAEIKYFLIQFVQQHHGRMRATLQDNFSRSLYFLDGRLADDIMEKNKKSKALESFLTGQSDEIDIHVTRVAIEDLRQAPYRASVDYEKVYFTPGTRQEVRRERYVGNFVFAVQSRVTNAMIPINPLGLTITYFREDQAFN